MKAIIVTQYGSPEVLKLQEIETPKPKDNEILIKVIAASVTAADSMLRKGTPYYARLFLGLNKPTKPIPGTGYAGVVETVGKDVREYNVGDRVFGETGLGFSANAEYVCMPEEGVLAPLSDSLSFEEAAPICDGMLTSWNFLKNIAAIKRGQTVLINGAAGSLGSAAIQIAKVSGAKVIGVCSTTNIKYVLSLGADEVIDYTKEDFTLNLNAYDIIYDTVGKRSYSSCKKALSNNGLYLSPVLNLPLLFQVMFTSLFDGKKAKFSATGLLPVKEQRIMISNFIKLIESGQINLMISKRFTLAQTPQAHQLVDTGHKRGNFIIEI